VEGALREYAIVDHKTIGRIAWANTLFGELVLTTYEKHPQLLD